MGDALNEFVFKGMGKRTMSDIVQEYGAKQSPFFRFGYVHLLLPQERNGLLHQVHGTQCMVKPRVMGPGIHQVAQPHLGYPTQPLKIGMSDQLKNEIIGNPDKSVNWIIEYSKLGRSLQRNGICGLKGRKLPQDSSIENFPDRPDVMTA